MSTRSLTIILGFLIIFTFISLEILKHAEKNSGAVVKEVTINLRNHKFDTEIIELNVGEKLILTIHNKDDAAEEFDSADLNKEKIISANSTATIHIGPLKAGEYEFDGEFNPKTAHGKIIVK